MRRSILFALIVLFSGIAIGQNDHTKKLANEIEILTATIESNPYIVQPYVERAQAIFMLNAMNPEQELVPFNLRDALKDMDVAISLHCHDPYLFSMRAELKRDINIDYRGAIEDMSMAIELDPDNPEFYMQRANYQNVNEGGCVNYRMCAAYDDKRCKQIVKEACM